jgi:hypothetical protein
MSELTTLERTTLAAALSGSGAWRRNLRQQIDNLEVISRQDTGPGVYTNFKVKQGAPLVEIPHSVYREPPEVRASHPAIPGGAIFLVWLKDGRIDCLEMASGLSPVPNEDAFVLSSTISAGKSASGRGLKVVEDVRTNNVITVIDQGSRK